MTRGDGIVGKVRSAGFGPGGRYRMSIEFSDHESYQQVKSGVRGIVVGPAGITLLPPTVSPGVLVKVKPEPE